MLWWVEASSKVNPCYFFSLSWSVLNHPQPFMWETCFLTYMFVIDSSQLCYTRLIWGYSKLIPVSNQLQKYPPWYMLFSRRLCWTSEKHIHLQQLSLSPSRRPPSPSHYWIQENMYDALHTRCRMSFCQSKFQLLTCLHPKTHHQSRYPLPVWREELSHMNVHLIHPHIKVCGCYLVRFPCMFSSSHRLDSHNKTHVALANLRWNNMQNMDWKLDLPLLSL